MQDELKISQGEQQVRIEQISKRGYKIVWTIDADEFELSVHGEWHSSDGTVTEDAIKLQPIDKNRVALFI